MEKSKLIFSVMGAAALINELIRSLFFSLFKSSSPGASTHYWRTKVFHLPRNGIKTLIDYRVGSKELKINPSNYNTISYILYLCNDEFIKLMNVILGTQGYIQYLYKYVYSGSWWLFNLGMLSKKAPFIFLKFYFLIFAFFGNYIEYGISLFIFQILH